MSLWEHMLTCDSEKEQNGLDSGVKQSQIQACFNVWFSDFQRLIRVIYAEVGAGRRRSDFVQWESGFRSV